MAGLVSSQCPAMSWKGAQVVPFESRYWSDCHRPCGPSMVPWHTLPVRLGKTFPSFSYCSPSGLPHFPVNIHWLLWVFPFSYLLEIPFLHMLFPTQSQIIFKVLGQLVVCSHLLAPGDSQSYFVIQICCNIVHEIWFCSLDVLSVFMWILRKTQ